MVENHYKFTKSDGEICENLSELCKVIGKSMVGLFSDSVANCLFIVPTCNSKVNIAETLQQYITIAENNIFLETKKWETNEKNEFT